MKELFSFPFEWKRTVNQCYQIGYRSLSLISLTSFITGIVFTKQTRTSLAFFFQTGLAGDFIFGSRLRSKIASDGPIGNKIVILCGGEPSGHPVADNGILYVEAPLTTDDMVATLQKINRNLLGITGNVKSISNKIDTGIKNLESGSVKLNDDLEAVQPNFLLKGFF